MMRCEGRRRMRYGHRSGNDLRCSLGDSQPRFNGRTGRLGKTMKLKIPVISGTASVSRVQRRRGAARDKESSCAGGKRCQRDDNGGMVGQQVEGKQQDKTDDDEETGNC